MFYLVKASVTKFNALLNPMSLDFPMAKSMEKLCLTSSQSLRQPTIFLHVDAGKNALTSERIVAIEVAIHFMGEGRVPPW